MLLTRLQAQTVTGFLSIKPSATALGCGCTGCNDAAYIGGVTYPDAAGGCGTTEPTGNTGNCSSLSKSIVMVVPANCTVNVTGCMADRTGCAGGTHGPGMDGGDQFSMVGTGGTLNGNSGIQTGSSNAQICASITQVGGQITFNLTANRVSELLTYTASYTGPSCMPGILPIELVYLTIERNEESLELNWATASEHNSDSFDVEYSDNALTFQKYTSVAAQGESRKFTTYKTLLPDTFKNNIMYFRLRLNDRDGAYEYSPIIVWQTNADINFSLAPNPTESGQLMIRSATKLKAGAKAELFDYTGNLLMQQQLEGVNSLLDLSEFERGMYLLRLNVNGNVIYKKVVYH